MKKCLPWVLGTIFLSVHSFALAQTIQIGALVSGQITQVKVKPGQKVRAGQLLMVIDSSRIQAKLKAAEAQAAAKKFVLDDARVELDQALDLFDRTVTSKRVLDGAQLAFDIAKQAHLKAKADVEYLQAWFKYYRITAPVSAKVKSIQAPKGSTVFKENTPLLTLEK